MYVQILPKSTLYYNNIVSIVLCVYAENRRTINEMSCWSCPCFTISYVPVDNTPRNVAKSTWQECSLSKTYGVKTFTYPNDFERFV